MRAITSAGLAFALSIGTLASLSGSGLAQVEPTPITVTSNSDLVNGSTSTVTSLQANPGPDGISLREAIVATNHDPGTYAIGFDPVLAGTVIIALTEMPTLTGGGVSIDGDIDGNGEPDVTIRNDSQRVYVLSIASSDNRLQSLALKGALFGVALTPATLAPAPPGSSLPTGQTFANNVLSRLVITDVSFFGIGFPGGHWFSGCEESACETHNTWSGTKIVRNTIHSRYHGIELVLGSVIGDHINGVDILDNTIRLNRDGCEPGNGVHLAAGQGGRGTTDTRITNAVITGNTIVGDAQSGIRVAAGSGSHSNAIVGVRVTRNHVNVGVERRAGCMRMGVFVTTGDGASDTFEPDANPIYGEDNLIRDVLIKRNAIAKGNGIRVLGGCCGARRNTVKDIQIIENTIDVIGFWPGILVHAQLEGGKQRATASNRVIDIEIDSNRVSMSKLGSDVETSVTGGISIGGAEYSGGTDLREGVVRNVRITNNRIDTSLIGIILFGGWSLEPGEAIANLVNRVVVVGNRIPHAPRASVRYNSSTQGISLLGGGLDAHRNRVTCMRIRNNLVAGAGNRFSVLENYSSPRQNATATRNVVRRSCR